MPNRAAISCVHCGKSLNRRNSSRDHVPSRFLLKRPFPAELSTIRICVKCNASFAPDEEYFGAFLGFMISDGLDTRVADLEKRISSNWRLQDHFLESAHVGQSETSAQIWVEPDETRLLRVFQKNAMGHRAIDKKGQRIPPPDANVMAPLASIIGTPAEKCFASSENWQIVQKHTYLFQIINAGHRICVRTVIRELLVGESVWGTPGS